MKIIFNIDYYTQWGEKIFIAGDIPELNDERDTQVGRKMSYYGNGHWTLEIEITPAQGRFKYHYSMRDAENMVRKEWGKPHTIDIDTHATTVRIFDKWSDTPTDKAAYSTAFMECINPHKSDKESARMSAGTLTFITEAPFVPSDMELAICGSCESLGKWDVNRAVSLNPVDFPVWNLSIPLKGTDRSIEYKYMLIDKKSREVVAWEPRNNRMLDIPAVNANDTIVCGGDRVGNPFPWYRGAGTAIPVFSLRSENDFGVGDFHDLLLLVDWAKQTHQQFIQLLPINDTTMTHTWTDSYPYNANSTFALHPMYLRVEAMGKLNDNKLAAEFEKLKSELNALPDVDYEKANNAKSAYTRALYKQDYENLSKNKDFARFIEKNREWLLPYSAYCVLRDNFGTPDIRKWGEYAEYAPSKVAKFIAENEYEIRYICYLQYHLDKQMRYVLEYAHKNGVAIKGDIPIGISRDSVDAWLYPKLFNLECSAGAPPDDFSIMGQNWGFPTYNWDMMSHDGFKWWKSRLRKMSEYFDAYRIDHVLGFFRIWQIPLDALHGLLGTFNPALPFSADELRDNYHFTLNPEVQTKPFIREYMMNDVFGEYADDVRNNYLDAHNDGIYTLRESFDTQRKVADYFAGMPECNKNSRICNGLLGLIDDVLFIEDTYEKGKYHPRISAQFTYSYRSLPDYEKQAFDRLYNDFFYHRHNDFWKGKAMRKLPPLIDSTGMLCCAEDLGMIPACVPDVMDQLQMLSLEIQRMPKNPQDAFGNPLSYPYLSVCTTSTHDMGGIRLWWEENRVKTQQFYNQVLHEQGEAPIFAEPWICEKIIRQNLASPSMLCILPIQDWMSCDGNIRRHNPHEEQINVPANPHHYWRYRMHLNMENLLADKKFNEHIALLIRDSGR